MKVFGCLKQLFQILKVFNCQQSLLGQLIICIHGHAYLRATFEEAIQFGYSKHHDGFIMLYCEVQHYKVRYLTVSEIKKSPNSMFELNS